ncbi:MAG: hypothetical protein AAF674_16850 [Pseudomonadota bacterium]
MSESVALAEAQNAATHVRWVATIFDSRKADVQIFPVRLLITQVRGDGLPCETIIDCATIQFCDDQVIGCEAVESPEPVIIRFLLRSKRIQDVRPDSFWHVSRISLPEAGSATPTKSNPIAAASTVFTSALKSSAVSNMAPTLPELRFPVNQVAA